MDNRAHCIFQNTLPTQAAALNACIDRAVARARECGAIKTIETESTRVQDQGIPFVVKWLSSLQHKEQAHREAAADALQQHARVCRNPGHNPFLPPEPALTLGRIGTKHLCVLNKFPVQARHLLLVTSEFEDQTDALTPADFAAVLALLGPLGGLAFYNGGKTAGASQRHKHMQWIPDSIPSQNFASLCAQLDSDPRHTEWAVHPHLPYQHVFIPLAPNTPADTVHAAFAQACRAVGINATASPMPPYNLLFNREWLLVVPRSCEDYAGISINALGFAASLFVRRVEQVAQIRTAGPLNVLRAVALPR